ncbi:MAG: glycine--tRNA ligase subunit beta, partial [Elusimicrobiota bacterium]
MSNYPLLIEIGHEDLPPSDIALVQENGKENVSDILNTRRIEYKKINIFTTPRRTALIVNEIASHQKSTEEKIKGPPYHIAQKQGKPTAAGKGFAGKMGVKFEDLEVEKTSAGRYCFY